MRRRHPDVAATLAATGSLYTKERKFAEAEALLRRVLEIRLKPFGETNALTQITIRAFVGLYTAWNKPAEAADYRARLVPAETKPAAGK